MVWSIEGTKDHQKKKVQGDKQNFGDAMAKSADQRQKREKRGDEDSSEPEAGCLQVEGSDGNAGRRDFVGEACHEGGDGTRLESFQERSENNSLLKYDEVFVGEDSVARDPAGGVYVGGAGAEAASAWSWVGSGVCICV